MTINDSAIAECAEELSETMTGSKVLIGTLTHPPVIIIFDNQGTASVEISQDTGPTWKTFPAGEALVLDLRDKRGLAENFSFRKGTSFYGNGASGTFSISYIYAVERGAP